MTRYKVWGMTARILVDAARVAYGEEPDFEVIHHLINSPMHPVESSNLENIVQHPFRRRDDDREPF